MKKNNVALCTLIAIGLVSSLTVNLLAQNKVSADVKQKQTPNLADKVLQTYIDISSLPMDKRRKVFIEASAEEKANLFKLHLALQFIKRPNLNKEQKELIVDSISMITPQSYDLENPGNRVKAQQDASVLEARAKTLFQGKDAFEIFASLGGEKTDAELLQIVRKLIGALVQLAIG